MRKFLLPLLLLFIFISESIFVELFPVGLLDDARIIVPRFLMITLLFLTIYGPKKYGIIYSFIFGLLFDIVYTEIIGIYLFIFPLVSYIVSKLMKILQTNIVIVSLVTILGVILLEMGVYEMNFLIHQTSMDFSSFVSLRLIPTVIFNLVITCIVAYPLKKHFENLVTSLDV
ncbi:rod shape-determining protein MreD [Cytobacillus dafuensis]|uniref:Rod shape-determining protein MreD n=1 Tax=Cytobacillus dafuensis TaxID=1742359 RepID=A0A5B8Z745_CYTDA|nr:rod shape-determining protein MreD [Cytobacillus dafuensis]QED48788.1 rod shape-determining protein MreD [Cytobacillus dafuensis]